METKYIILVILILAGLSVWILPKTKLASRMTMTEGSYIGIHLIGLVCAIVGVAITVLYPESILEDHLYEIVLLPVVAAYAVYPAIIARIKKTTDLYDEKQIWDTTRAAALSLGATTMTMFVVYAFYADDVLAGVIWFPLLMFSVVGWYSAGTLLLHRSS